MLLAVFPCSDLSEGDNWALEEIEIDITEDIDEEDAGVGAEDDDEDADEGNGGGGCRTTDAGLGPLALLAGLLAARRRA